MDLARSAAIISDDHELFRVALAQILSGRFGFGRVVETSSLDDALERLSDTPDVVLALFDLDMPGMTGPSSLQAVREVFPAVRVVVITASKKRDDILKALEAGVHGYIMKTLRLDEITNALKIVIDGSIYVPLEIADLALTPAKHSLVLDGPVATKAQLADLTPRQQDVLRLLRDGKSNKEMARILSLGAGTVKVHVAAVLRSLGVPNRTAAASIAVQLLDER